MFVDETKAKHHLVAASILVGELEAGRRRLRQLVLPRQRSIHMKSEQDSRRRQILNLIVDMATGPTVLYDAGDEGSQLARRAACLERVVRDCEMYPSTHITLDLDTSVQSSDRQRLIEYCRAAGLSQRVTYDHQTRAEELLLAIPDAVAWAWARGGEWRDRVRPIVRYVHVEF